MAIIYTDSIANVTEEMLHGFFVGWPNPPSRAKHLQLLKQSSYITLAKDSETKQVIGFITAVSDHVLSAYIPLLEVLPAYQDRGIGTRLVQRMLKQLKSLYMIDLLCDAELQPYYQTFGMQRASGMFIRQYANQNGEYV